MKESGYQQQQMDPAMSQSNERSAHSMPIEQQHYRQQQDWETLSDVSRQVDERDIEPDYFIDQAPRPLFIPQEQGVDKQIHFSNRNLFDFKLESEPIL